MTIRVTRPSQSGLRPDSVRANPVKGTPDSPPPDPQDGLSLTGSLAGGILSGAGMTALTLSKGPEIGGKTAKAIWRSLSLSPAIKVASLMVLPTVALCAPIVAPVVGVVQGLWRGAQQSDSDQAISTELKHIKGLQKKADQLTGWLDRVAVKTPDPSLGGSYAERHYLTTSEFVRHPSKTWNVISNW